MGDDTISHRIKQFYESHLRVSQNNFAEMIGANQSTISAMMQRNSGVNTKVITLLLKRFPQINAKWLLLGEGEMLETNGNNVTGLQTIKGDGNVVVGNKVGTLDDCAKQLDVLEQRIKDLEALLSAQAEIISLLKSK